MLKRRETTADLFYITLGLTKTSNQWMKSGKVSNNLILIRYNVQSGLPKVSICPKKNLDTFGGPDVHCFNSDIGLQINKLMYQIETITKPIKSVTYSRVFFSFSNNLFLELWHLLSFCRMIHLAIYHVILTFYITFITYC